MVKFPSHRLLGNVAISKISLRTRKIMVMYSNEGKSVSTYPRRPGAEASSDAVDVVELLLVTTDQAPNVCHLRVLHTFSSMTSLELLIQQSVEGEFRQHDGMATVMVK